jgi:hypothetical protein
MGRNLRILLTLFSILTIGLLLIGETEAQSPSLGTT